MLRRIAISSVLIVAAIAFAQVKVNQGSPGTQGAWPVRQGSGQDGGVWVVFDPRGSGLDSTLVAMGEVAGATVVNKFGRNPDIDTASTPEDLWGGGGVYTGFPLNFDGGPTAEPLQLFSASADDTAGGLGARSVTVEGLDINYTAISETVTLNGVTPVVTAQSFARVNFAYVASVGDGGYNAGLITARHNTTTANVFTALPIGFNQCQCGAYTVPANKTAYIVNLGVQMLGGSTAQLEFALWWREPLQPPRLRRPYLISDSTTVEDEIPGGLRVPQKTDFIVRFLTSATNNVSASGHMDMFLIDN